MGRPTGQLDRSLDALTADVVRGKMRRDNQLAHTATREVEQQVRVPLQGIASADWGFIDKKVGWLFPFIWAPDQRGVQFKTPHFSYGVELGIGADELVVIHAQIVEWVQNDSSWLTGARVRFAATAPASIAAVSFSALAHLTFQGWAAEDEEGVIR